MGTNNEHKKVDASSHDHVLITNKSECSDEIIKEIKDKIFKLKSRFVEDFKEIQHECLVPIGGKISFDLSEISSHRGGSSIKITLG